MWIVLILLYINNYLYGTYYNNKQIQRTYLLLVIGVVIGVPAMIMIGRWHLFKVQKATEYISTMHGAITGYSSFNMQVRQIELLEEINKKLLRE